MKKYLFLSAVVALTLAGCASQEEFDNSLEMTFNAYSVKPSSKALIGTGAYPTDETFGVFAYYLGDTKKWASNKSEAVSYFKEEVIYDDTRNLWAPENKHYWPAIGSVTFFAYSPYTVDAACSTDKGINLTAYTVTKDDDFLACGPVEDKVANDKTGLTGVDIMFGHKLSLVDFKIKTKEDYTTDGWTIKVKEIILDSIYSTGDYTQITTSATDVWSNQKNQIKYTFTAYDAANGGQEATTTAAVYNSIWRSGTESDALLALPQTLNTTKGYTAKLIVKYTLTQKIGGETLFENVEKTKEAVLSTEKIPAWLVNKKYIYTIIISLDEILFDPSVADWDGPVNEDIDL